MNKDVIGLVESLGGTVLFDGALIQFTDTTFMAALKKIYESGALEEREACAKVCDEMEEEAEGMECCKWPTPIDCAYVIRTRGQA
jgi:hypothetical protein